RGRQLPTEGAAANLTVVEVEDTLVALSKLGQDVRAGIGGPVVAITGSNGKTIVKDALVSLIADRSVAASPGSFNSQLGVPLSVLAADPQAALGIFEAGISRPGEMARLREILRPDYGVLTNVGVAHMATLGGREAIAEEKMKLFSAIPAEGWVLLPAVGTCPLIEDAARALTCGVHRLGDPGLPCFSGRASIPGGQVASLQFPGGEAFEVTLHTRSDEIIEDLQIAVTAAYLLGVDAREIRERIDGYRPQPTRM
ncbi:MAG: hypothetical protein KC457_35315, partial [Myxococcales bacterium]|nr:hypothetical protein [Myxococcales bacterium]